MRVAFMTFACPEWEWEQVLRSAADLGYDGVEPRIDSQHQHGLEVALDTAGRERVRRQAAEAGVELCCLATSLQFIAMDAASRVVLLDKAKARIALAAELGMPGLRVFGGPLPEGRGLDDAVEAAAENLHAVGDLAHEAGVELWVETHDTFSRGAVCARAVAGADHPAVAINYDVMHPYRHGEDLDETFTAVGPYLRHAHWHDALASAGAPMITKFGEGELPLLEILQRLAAHGYDGYLSGEWFSRQLGDTPEESLQHYVAATRDLLGQL